MSLFPLASHNWWDVWDYPSRILDLHYGMPDEDVEPLHPSIHRRYLLGASTQDDIESVEVSDRTDAFKVMLNVCHFKPGEIHVKVVENAIVVHARHRENADEHGFVSREFTRTHVLPEGIDPETLKTSVTSNGILVIEAPTKAVEPMPDKEPIVPVTQGSGGSVLQRLLTSAWIVM